VSRAVPRLHAVTDRQVLSLPDFATRARAIAAAGDVALHARAGSVDAQQVLALANLLLETGALVLVNDRADVVPLVAAGGVHLPAAGLPIGTVREMLGPDVLIGRSTHSASEAREAHAAGADYVFLGPIWPTASHPDRAPLGVDVIAAAVPARIVAIGGVTPARTAQCREAGAWGVAAISALWGVEDSGAAAARFLVSLER
jgi:thiamine-phosphate pyrophosphorylase